MARTVAPGDVHQIKRVRAVAADATMITTTKGSRRHRASPATTRPTSRASITIALPSPTVDTIVSAASSAAGQEIDHLLHTHGQRTVAEHERSG